MLPAPLPVGVRWGDLPLEEEEEEGMGADAPIPSQRKSFVVFRDVYGWPDPRYVDTLHEEKKVLRLARERKWKFWHAWIPETGEVMGLAEDLAVTYTPIPAEDQAVLRAATPAYGLRAREPRRAAPVSPPPQRPPTRRNLFDTLQDE